jgi:hypothetical protein
MPLQAEWRRTHRLAPGHLVKASVWSLENGGYQAIVTLNTVSNASVHFWCTSPDAARAQADKLALKAFPHDCAKRHCLEWTETMSRRHDAESPTLQVMDSHRVPVSGLRGAR